MKAIYLLLGFTLFGFLPQHGNAQTIHLRDNPIGYQINGISSGGVIQTIDPHNLVAGMMIQNHEVCVNDSSRRYISNYQVVGYVHSPVIDSTHFKMDDLTHTPIVESGTWCDGSTPGLAGLRVQWGGQVTPYTISDGIHLGMQDGLNGAHYRQVVLSTDNGLTSAVKSGSVLTVSLSFTPIIAVGAKVGIFGTTGNAIDGEFSVATVVGNSYTLTLTGSPASAANQDWANNLTCGPTPGNPNVIGGSSNCVVLSQWAVSTLSLWASITGWSNQWISTPMLHVYQGGSGVANNSNWLSVGYLCATDFMIRRQRQGSLSCAINVLTHLNFFGEFAQNENFGPYLDYAIASWHYNLDLGLTVQQAYPFLTSTQQSALRGQILNDNDTACNKNQGVQDAALVTGAPVAGDGTSVTLASSDSQADGYYVGDIVRITQAGTGAIWYGYITNYVSKKATISIPSAGYYGVTTYGAYSSGGTYSYGWTVTYGGNSYTSLVNSNTGHQPDISPSQWALGIWPIPTATDTYAIFPAVTATTTTVTGHHTHFTSTVSVGDQIAAGSPIAGLSQVWNYYTPKNTAYVTVRTSDTVLAIIDDEELSVDLASGFPQIPIYLHQWTTGDCGLYHYEKYSGNFVIGPGRLPQAYYVDSGLGGRALADGNGDFIYPMGKLQIDLPLVADDSRAIADIEEIESYAWNYSLPWDWNYHTAYGENGTSHYWGQVAKFHSVLEMELKNSFTGFPNLTPETWLRDKNLFYQYNTLPDHRAWSGDSTTMWGWNIGYNNSNSAVDPTDTAADFLGYTNPNASTSSQYLKDFTTKHNNFPQGSDQDASVLAWLNYNPAITASDHTVQPKQFIFNDTRNSVCSSLSPLTGDVVGQYCIPTLRSDALVSMSDWGYTNPSATSMFFQSRSFSGHGYDNCQAGALGIYRTGYLLGDDNLYVFSGNYDIAEISALNAEFSDMPSIGGASVLGTSGGPCIAYFDRWASRPGGGWATNYGDTTSTFAYARSNMTGMWAISGGPTYAYREVGHFKKPGAHEVIVDHHSIAMGSATTLVHHLHFTQNGEPNNSGYGLEAAYPEGDTVCTSCAGTNPTGYVYEHESGAASDSLGPARKAGLTASIFSPGTITVRDDGVWSLANPNYNNASGSGGTLLGTHSHRVSISAGSTIGASATSLDDVVVYELCPDYTASCPQTATALNPDANWTGVQTADKVAIFARGGTTHSTMTGFTTTHAGTAQYLFGGLTPGTYTVTVGGTGVAGSPFTVAANDNSIEFENTSGVVSINGSVASCAITTTSLPGGTVGIAYSQTIATSNCVPNPPTSNWSVASGSLPTGLTLGSTTGMISGTPTTTGLFTFTIQTIDTISNTAVSGTLTILVGAGASIPTSVNGVKSINGVKVIH
jgi:hypothetical protein